MRYELLGGFFSLLVSFYCVPTYLDKVSVLLALFKQWRCLGDVRVDPDTDAETALLETLEVSKRVREHL